MHSISLVIFKNPLPHLQKKKESKTNTIILKKKN